LNRSESFRRAVDLALAGHRNEQLLQLGSLHYQIIANPVITDGRIAGAVLLIVDVTEKEERKTCAGNLRPMSHMS
jgi:two-component system phosphate regulon sensor histidine kinase PhoR